MAPPIQSAGIHVTLDAYVKDPSVFEKDKLTALFESVIKILDAKILAGPEFVEVPLDPGILRRSRESGEFHDEGGITSFCVINKSHVSIHAWPLQSFFSMDVFSCGTYLPHVVIDAICRRLGVKSASVNIIYRKKGAEADVRSLYVT